MQSNKKYYSNDLILTDPDLILDIPANDLGYEMCEIAVSKKPSLLASIPYLFLEVKNFHIVRLALKTDGLAIKYLDAHRIDRDMCLLASKHLKKELEDCFLSYIPYRFIDKKICIRSVKSNPHNIDYVPLKFMDHEIGKLLMDTNQDVLLEKIPLLTRKHLNQRRSNA